MSSRQVKAEYAVDYNDFLNHPEPMKLLAELAVLRTTLVEYQQSRTIVHTIKRQTLARAAAGEIEKRAEAQDGEISVDDMYNIICAHMVKDSGTLTVDDVRAITSLVDTISKVAERAKRIEDGLTLKLSWDKDCVQIVNNFIMFVCLKFVPIEAQPFLAAATRDFLAGKGVAAETLSLSAAFERGDVYEG